MVQQEHMQENFVRIAVPYFSHSLCHSAFMCSLNEPPFTFVSRMFLMFFSIKILSMRGLCLRSPPL